MAKKNNNSPIEQLQKHKEYFSPQVENYLAFRLAKKKLLDNHYYNWIAYSFTWISRNKLHKRFKTTIG